MVWSLVVFLLRTYSNICYMSYNPAPWEDLADIEGRLSNKAWGGVVYGQYTTAKGNAECLDTALNRGILAMYHNSPRWLPM
jgi:hypothetical protein